MQASLYADRAKPGDMRRGLVGVVASGVLAVLGASAANAQSGSAGTSSSSAPVTIRVVAPDASSGDTPFFVAQKLGYFKDAGLEVKFLTMGGGAPAMAAALKSGEVDVAMAGALQHMTQIAQGVISGKMIGEFIDSNNYQILAGKGITDVKQLKGKVFGISSYSGGDQLWAQAVYTKLGMGIDDSTWLPVGVPQSRISALALGRVDATVESEHAVTVPDSVEVILNEDDSNVPFISGAIFATQKILTSDKPALQRFLAAIGKGSDWTRAHPGGAISACLDSGATAANCKVAIDVALAAKSPYTWSSSTRVNVDGVKAMIPLYAEAVPQMKDTTLDTYVDASVVAGGP